MILVINEETCTGCGLCIDICPLQALRMVDGKAVVDMEICDLDGICIPTCPVNAIHYQD